MQGDFITADDVAQLTGFDSGRAFLVARRRLEDDEGFPAPMPTRRRPLVWRRSAVSEWVGRQGCAADAHAAARRAGGNVHLLQLARS